MIVKTIARLNIRKEPNGEVIRIAEVGERLKVVSEDGGWYRLEDGYCMEKFTEKVATKRKKKTEQEESG